jgi:hypothetical protein
MLFGLDLIDVDIMIDGQSLIMSVDRLCYRK